MLFVGGASSPANPINTQRRKATNIERPTSNTEQRSQKSCPSLWAGFSTPRAQLAPSGGHSPPLQQQDTEHEAKDEPQNIQQGISNAEGQQPNSSALWAGLSSPAIPTRTQRRPQAAATENVFLTHHSSFRVQYSAVRLHFFFGLAGRADLESRPTKTAHSLSAAVGGAFPASRGATPGQASPANPAEPSMITSLYQQ